MKHEPQRMVHIGRTIFGNDRPLALIAGPCQIESRTHALDMAKALRDICLRRGVTFVYKSSFDKANRTSGRSPRGVGIEEGCSILCQIKDELGIPVITDVHNAEQCEHVAAHVDALQIPAFLCRQTDLLMAAARTGKPLNVKKGQFLAPWDMQHVMRKLLDAGNDQLMVCERGVSFGYNTLVSDMRALPVLKSTCICPVIFDATHSVQQPGGQGTQSGGEREFVGVLASAAVAVGIAGVFLEVHDQPDRALSDGPNMLDLCQLAELLPRLLELDEVAKAYKL